MRSKLMRPLLILAIIFASLLPLLSVDAKETATPGPSNVSICGPVIMVAGVVPPYPNGVNFLGGCVFSTKASNGTETYTISSRYWIEPNVEITTNEETAMHQFGATLITVEQGSLIVTVKSFCVDVDPCATAGTAFFGRTGADSATSWTPMVKDVATTLYPGDSVWLENVTVNVKTDIWGSTVQATGTFPYDPGAGGCPAVCFHMP
jgi:hypothetical protein